MLVFRLFILFFKIIFFSFLLIVRYFLLFLFKLFYFLVFLPIYIVFLFKSVFLLSLFLFRSIFVALFYKFLGFWSYIKVAHIIEPYAQLVYHFGTLKVIKERLMRRYYFYRRSYYVCGYSVKFLIKAILAVEPNALLIKRSVQPLGSLWSKIWNLPSSPTRVGHRFRIGRRLIKFFLGIVTLFYPIQLLLKFGLWYITGYLVSLLRFLRRKKIIKTKKQIKLILRMIIWIKLLFVWSDLPFVLIFKPGISKKYPQFEDIQPDTRVIKHEVWQFALLRDCYFDYEDVLNGYYIFHIVRPFSRVFFNLIIFSFVLIYFIIINFLYILQFFYLLFYVPFKFIYIYSLLTAGILLLKLVLVLAYLVPIVYILAVLLLSYFLYRFVLIKYYYFYSQKYLAIFQYFIFFKTPNLSSIIGRFYLLFYYVVFKLRSLNYLVFSNIEDFFSIKRLFRFNSNLRSILNYFFGVNPHYANLLYYNTSYIFRRVRPYFLRFNNVQFIPYFFKTQKASRITPDQIKSFLKIGLNSKYPMYYFERLFDLEYSRLELEYELPYYWSFVRQAHSLNQGLLHPKFHVYGFFNFLKFYWNYFSFLNTNTILDTSSIYAHDFIQLFNSSASQIFSLLVNDFIELFKIKKFKLYTSTAVTGFLNNSQYFKLSSLSASTQWHLIHVKYYDKLLHFFWDYYDALLIRVVYYYYSVLATPNAVKIHSFFNDYAEKARHLVGWYVFAFYERMMGKLFLNVNKFEDYYDVNFDKSIDLYNSYLIHFKKFLGVDSFNSLFRKRFEVQKQSFEEEISDDVEKSVRLMNFEQKLNAQRKKNYNDTMSDFFTGSFSFFGGFYTFFRTNVFEFMTVLYVRWREYIHTSISRWSRSKKVFVFLIYFFKTFFVLWICIFMMIVLFSLFLIKEFIIKIIKKIKKIYV